MRTPHRDRRRADRRPRRRRPQPRAGRPGQAEAGQEGVRRRPPSRPTRRTSASPTGICNTDATRCRSTTSRSRCPSPARWSIDLHRLPGRLGPRALPATRARSLASSAQDLTADPQTPEKISVQAQEEGRDRTSSAPATSPAARRPTVEVRAPPRSSSGRTKGRPAAGPARRAS